MHAGNWDESFLKYMYIFDSKGFNKLMMNLVPCIFFYHNTLRNVTHIVICFGKAYKRLYLNQNAISMNTINTLQLSGVMSQNIWGGAQSLRGSEATKPEGA